MRNPILNAQTICNEGDLIAYLVDCTLATVATMAMQKRRPKGEYERQKRIAQVGIDQMVAMGISTEYTRADEIAGIMSVEEWAKRYEAH